MRTIVAAFLLLLAGCPTSAKQALDETGDGAGSSPVLECQRAADCAPAGAKCCDCPTHAVPTTDASYRACLDVMCQPKSCGSPTYADCDAGKCVLKCSPVECNQSCGDGFVTDDNGCLTCECAPTQGECSIDTDCARVANDCCGCDNGGEDTAVPVSQIQAHDGKLMCPANPSCPGGNSCAPDLAARCVQGACALVSGTLPPNACGRADLAVCAVDTVCTLNADDTATMEGVGVCLPVP